MCAGGYVYIHIHVPALYVAACADLGLVVVVCRVEAAGLSRLRGECDWDRECWAAASFES